MRKRRIILCVLAASAWWAAQSESLRIESFEPTGRLVFNEVAGATNYRIGRAISPGGAWTNLSLSVTVNDGMATCTVPVDDSSMFFRVIAEGGFFAVPEGMSLVSAGRISGTNTLAAGEVYSASYPQSYDLTVDCFGMDSTEVTYSQWKDVYDWAVTNGYSFESAGEGKAPDHPVQSVSWYDALKWCNARSENEGRPACYTIGGAIYRSGQQIPSCNPGTQGFRLPTAEEWEFAARGGLVSRNYSGGDGLSHADANYYDFSGGTGHHSNYQAGGFPFTNPVQAFSVNAYGLYGMAGNVWEWCWDGSGAGRELRGGSWDAYEGYARCGFRGAAPADSCDYDIGFRTVCCIAE